jgi:uncharacterized membrane protein YraQ (UPF0718 family)/copper chaperone CopZ
MLIHLLKEIVFFFNEVAIYLLFGFLVAGVLHVMFPESLVRRHLGKGSLGSVFKATVFGIPLPLCSCGVVPVATSLKRSGASRGAVVSFLVSTPQIGADSFMVTYSLIGWVFALFRIAASFITSIFAGILVNLSGRRDERRMEEPAKRFDLPEPDWKERLRGLYSYVEYSLLGSIANALVAGIILAGIISAYVPESLFQRYLGSPLLSMLLMMMIGIPMYVCAAASTPIAASLILKGLSPGAALVFLLTGPATNAVNITTVSKIVGKKSTALYLTSIAVVSLSLGYLLNTLHNVYGLSPIHLHHQHEILPSWLKIGGSVLLLGMLGWYYVQIKLLPNLRKERVMSSQSVELFVKGMTCMHCVETVKNAVSSVDGVSDVNVLLDKGVVLFRMEKQEALEQVKTRIRNAGYEV